MYIKDESNSSFLFSLSAKEKFKLIQKDNNAIKRLKDKKSINFSDTFKIFDKAWGLWVMLIILIWDRGMKIQNFLKVDKVIKK